MPDSSISSGNAPVREVRAGEYTTAEQPWRLVAPALGSCVGVAIYDRTRLRGGLAHVMLPAPYDDERAIRMGRFASEAVPALVAMLLEGGSNKYDLIAKIAGGASMFGGETARIGERNVEEVKRQLGLLGVRLTAEDTGAHHARTAELDLSDGRLVVRSYLYGILEL